MLLISVKVRYSDTYECIHKSYGIALENSKKRFKESQNTALKYP